jgi:hypothetical protein
VPWLVFLIFGGISDFWLKQNIFFLVNAKSTPIAAVVRLILLLNFRQAFHTNGVPFYESLIRGSVGFV